MKKSLMCSIIILATISMVLSLTSCNNKADSEKDVEGTITVSGAWALYPMVVKWGEEFQKIHPKAKLDIAAGGAGKGMADALAGIVDIGMVSRDIYTAEVEKRAWWVSVTKDAVVPTVNENNPVITELLSKGITKQTLIDIWINGRIMDWGEIYGDKTGQYKIHVFTRSDACGAAQTWAKFLDKNQEDLKGVGVYGDPGLAEAVVQDISSIGYNNINYVYDNRTKSPVKGIRVLPIDINNNSSIDEFENFYETRDQIVEAIREGKYPSPPARDLHLVSQGKPKRKVVVEFIKWILTDGQKYVQEAGYINFSEQRLQMELAKLEAVK
jgi:phosphate transport system substrate-binding protein